jgi:hypothetical protein
MENQSDESDKIVPAQPMPAANATAATAQQAHFLMRCRRSYALCKRLHVCKKRSNYNNKSILEGIEGDG